MTEERKHAILLAAVILTARELQPLLEEDFAASKPNMGMKFWVEVYTKYAVERAAHILDLIDAEWPAGDCPISRVVSMGRRNGQLEIHFQGSKRLRG